MAQQFTIRPRPADVARLKALFGDKKRGVAARAMQAAVSRTITTGVAMIARRIAQEVNLPIADIKSSIFSRRGSFDDPRGVISVRRGKPVWMGQFLSSSQRGRVARKLAGNLKGRVTPKGGVTVKVRKRSQPGYPASERLPKAFIGVMPKTAYIGVFERVGVKRAMKSGRYAGKVREVIRRLRGPSPFGVFANAVGEDGAGTMVEETARELSETLDKNIRSQISRFLAQGK
jgi:hypothetical protein